MLFKHSFHQAIANGEIGVTYRAWKRARVKVGNRYRLNAGGVVEVDEVRETPVAQVTDAAAHASGFSSRDALLRQLFPRGAGAPPPPCSKSPLPLRGRTRARRWPTYPPTLPRKCCTTCSAGCATWTRAAAWGRGPVPPWP